jgi:hypothetical protein
LERALKATWTLLTTLTKLLAKIIRHKFQRFTRPTNERICPFSISQRSSKFPAAPDKYPYIQSVVHYTIDGIACVAAQNVRILLLSQIIEKIMQKGVSAPIAQN